MKAKDTVKTYGELRTYCIGDMRILSPTDSDVKEALEEIEEGGKLCYGSKFY